MNFKNILIITILTIGFFACKRPGSPDPRICASKDIYKTTDTIKLINCSLRSTSQRWELPDGSKTNDNTIYFVPPSAGKYNFTIFVGSDDFVNEYSTTYSAVVQ